MARANPKGVGNTSGITLKGIPEELREILKIQKPEAELRLARLMRSRLSEVARVMGDDDAQAIDRAFATVIWKAVEEGDEKRLNFLLDRTVGKVAEKVETKHTHYVERIEEIEKATDIEVIEQAKIALTVLEEQRKNDPGTS